MITCDDRDQPWINKTKKSQINSEHSLLFFNGDPVVQTGIQKHLGMFIDTKFNFLDLSKTTFEKKLRQQDFFVNCG